MKSKKIIVKLMSHCNLYCAKIFLAIFAILLCYFKFHCLKYFSKHEHLFGKLCRI
jgi:hypothetical protein